LELEAYASTLAAQAVGRVQLPAQPRYLSYLLATGMYGGLHELIQPLYLSVGGCQGCCVCLVLRL
jgi:hypothetical protein